MPKILQQRAKCIGCNLCSEIWPLRWRVSRVDGKCTLVDGVEKKGIWQLVISADELSPNEQAAKACPVKIIKIVR